MCEHDTTPVFLPADGPSWSLLPSLYSLLSGGTVKPENTYSSILKVTGKVLESQALTLITATTSIHLPKPVLNPIGKDRAMLYDSFSMIWDSFK